jgi:diaminopimelate decarboxylase
MIQLGCGAVLASGNELKLARLAGFEPEHIIYNGNGKTLDELMLAVEAGVMVNIDSEFDLAHVQQIAQRVGKLVNVLLRINPDIDPGVHPYISTGLKDSKFGIRQERLKWFLDELKQKPSLKLVGLHCHLGSSIKEVSVFRDAAVRMMMFIDTVRATGFELAYLNLGGGLGVDYLRNSELIPTPAELLEILRAHVPNDLRLIIEPGRSLVATAAILVNRVIGVKSNGHKQFIVTDGSSAEFMRPSLYNAYHHIEFVEPIDKEFNTFDIVGPLCDSGDFLGKERQLPMPREGMGLVVCDVGAYGHVTCTTANIKLRPPEYLVDGKRLYCIRRAETFDEYIKVFETNMELTQ